MGTTYKSGLCTIESVNEKFAIFYIEFSKWSKIQNIAKYQNFD